MSYIVALLHYLRYHLKFRMLRQLVIRAAAMAIWMSEKDLTTVDGLHAKLSTPLSKVRLLSCGLSAMGLLC